MTKNDQIWPKNAKKHLHIAHITHQNAPKHPEVVVEKKGFPTCLDALPKIIYLEPGSGPFQISIWVILPVENTPKHPKTPQNMYKNPQGPFLEKSTFGDFSTSMTHFRSFSALLGFWGGCQQGRNDQKWPNMNKNVRQVTIIARITQKNRPKPPHIILGKSDFGAIFDIFPKINYLEKGGAHRRNPHFRNWDGARGHNMTSMVKPTLGNLRRGSLQRFCYPADRDEGGWRRKSTFSFFFFCCNTPRNS